MITFSSLEPLDQKKRQAVGGVWDHYVSCSYLAMNNGLLMRRRCFACAQCGPCVRWIARKKKHTLYSSCVFSLAKILKISEKNRLRLVSYLLAD